jgi:hypothetical protein
VLHVDKALDKYNLHLSISILFDDDGISLSDKYAIGIINEREKAAEKNSRTYYFLFPNTLLTVLPFSYRKRVLRFVDFSEKKRSIISSIIGRKYQHKNNNNSSNSTLHDTVDYWLVPFFFILNW